MIPYTPEEWAEAADLLRETGEELARYEAYTPRVRDIVCAMLRECENVATGKEEAGNGGPPSLEPQDIIRFAFMSADEITNTLRRLVRRLTADAHQDEAEALVLVDALMREYAFTRDPLTPDAEQFSDDLRRLVAEWMCDSSKPTCAKEAGAGA